MMAVTALHRIAVDLHTDIPFQYFIIAEYGMQTMEACLKQLVTSGLITYEDALARAYDLESFKQIMA